MGDILPLYDFFEKLRKQKGFALGIDEFYALIDILKKDSSYLEDKTRLFSLAKLLWYKPNQNKGLFKELFEDSIENLVERYRVRQNEVVENEEDIEKEDEIDEKEKPRGLDDQTDDSIENGNEAEKLEEDITDTQDEDELEEIEEEREVYLNIVDKTGGEQYQFKENAQLLKGFTVRLTEQSGIISQRRLNDRWQRFRHIQAGQETSSVDMRQTIAKLANQGFIERPVFKLQEKNEAHLLFLIDCSDSMLAFERIAQAVVESAKANEIQTAVYYFRNLPNQSKDKSGVVFKNTRLTAFDSLESVLYQHRKKAQKTPIIVISDAGASKGNLNFDRLELTKDYLKQIRKASSRIVWLNPMPEDRWEFSTAELIQSYVPMFPITVNGLNNAIACLRGKVTLQTEPL